MKLFNKVNKFKVNKGLLLILLLSFSDFTIAIENGFLMICSLNDNHKENVNIRICEILEALSIQLYIYIYIRTRLRSNV